MTTRVHRHAWRALVTSSILLVALVPVQADGGHHHGHGTLVLPQEGAQATLTYPHGTYGLTFGTPQSHLVGHHEWRDAVGMTVTYPTYGNHTYEEEILLDLFTGQTLGLGQDFADSAAALHPVPLLAYEAQGTTYAGQVTWNALLPEALLWGRAVWPGLSWSVPPAFAYGYRATTHIAVDHDNHTVFTLTTLLEPMQPHMPTQTYVLQWVLEVPHDAVFAHERLLRTGTTQPDGTIAWESSMSVPATIITAGGDPLPFEGNSHATIVGERDQNLDYGPVGLHPYDPQPHSIFDLPEAADKAWSLDDEAVRVFKARAEDPYLAEVSASRAAGHRIDWAVHFLEAGGNRLTVHLDGFKVPGLPLVVATAEAEGHEAGTDHVPAEVRAAHEFAAVGQAIRVAEGAIGSDATRFFWWLDSGHAGPAASLATIYYGTVPSPVDAEEHFVRADLATGIVQGSATYGYGLTAQA